MDDERLKNLNNIFGKDYFEEHLACIRDIAATNAGSIIKTTNGNNYQRASSTTFNSKLP